MRILRNFQQTYSINQKGQSLVELATFGAVLLFCLAMLLQYGMQANYQQNLQMQAFRKALKAAYYKSGPGSSISLSVTHDKAIPDPRDPWGFTERRPISASASVTWDSNIQALYINDYGETPSQSDLPQSIIEINDRLALSDADLSDSGINSIGQGQGAFKVADYGNDGCRGSITMVLENTPAQRLATMEEYREVPINCANIIVKNRKSDEDDVGKQYAYVKIDHLVHTVSAADVDADGEAEVIIAVVGTQPCDDAGFCGGVGGWKYVDYQQGDIDTEYAAVIPWTNVSPDNQQGLIGDQRLVKSMDNEMVKQETPDTFSTDSTVNSSQEATHYIRLRGDAPGTRRPYTTTFEPAYGPDRDDSPEDVDANWSPAK